MAEPEPGTLAATPGARLRLVGSVLVLTMLVAMCAASVHRPGDFAGYVAVGEVVLAGSHAYDAAPPGVNTWPPVFGLLCVPIALLARVSGHLARGVWLGLELVVLLATLRLLVGLVHRRALVLDPRGDGLTLASPAVLVPLALAYVGLSANFYSIQVNLFVFALVLAGLVAEARGRPLGGGALIGIAAAVRLMPLVFVPYLAWRRRWRAAASATVAFLLVSLVPGLAYGWERFAEYVTSWRATVGAGWGSGRFNQSVHAMFDRYLGHGTVPFSTPPVALQPGSGEAAAAVATGIVLAATTLLALVLFRGPMRPAGKVALVEWSVVFLVGAVLGPVGWKSYLVVLLLPLLLLYALWRSPTEPPGVRRLAVVLLVASFLLLTLPSRDVVGRWTAHHLEMASVFTLGALVLLSGLFALRRRLAAAEGP